MWANTEQLKVMKFTIRCVYTQRHHVQALYEKERVDHKALWYNWSTYWRGLNTSVCLACSGSATEFCADPMQVPTLICTMFSYVMFSIALLIETAEWIFILDRFAVRGPLYDVNYHYAHSFCSVLLQLNQRCLYWIKL